MLETILAVMLPIVVTMLLGFFAGWHQDFDKEQAGVLNRMVLLYALPLILFGSIITTPFSEVTANITVVLWITISMIGGYAFIVLFCRFLLGNDYGLAALRALMIAGPAVAVIGIPILTPLYPTDATIAVAAGSLLMNVIQLPVTLTLINAADTGTPGAQTQSPLTQMGTILKNTFKEPVVWAPLSAFALILLGVDLPDRWESSFTMLGQATAGIALFAAGAILYSYKISLQRAVVVNVAMKNLVMPAIILAAMLLFEIRDDALGATVITVAMPTAQIAFIFAVQYQKAEREMASSLFFSTVLSLVTTGLFIYLAGWFI